MKFKAKTPIQRIGVILMMTPLIAFISLGIYWNFTEKLFIYSTSRYDYITRPKPNDDKNFFWYRMDDAHAWVKTDKICMNHVETKEAQKRKQIDCSKVSFEKSKIGEKVYFSEDQKACLKTVWAPECYISTLKDELGPIYSWQSSFDKFLNNFLNSKLFFLSVLLFFIGTFLWLGWAERMKVWIKTGE